MTADDDRYAVILAGMPDPSWIALGLSLAYLAYYFLASVYLTLRNPVRRAPAERQVHAAEPDGRRN